MQTATPRVLKLQDVIAATGLKRSTVFKLAAAGVFPKQFALGPGSRARGWLESEVHAWISQAAASRGGQH